MLKIRGSDGKHSPYSTAKRKRNIFPSVIWNYLPPQSLLRCLASWGCTMRDITVRFLGSCGSCTLHHIPNRLQSPELPLKRWFLFCDILHNFLGLLFSERIRRRSLGPADTKQRRQPVPPPIVVFALCPQFKPKWLNHLSSSIEVLVPEKGIQVKAADC